MPNGEKLTAFPLRSHTRARTYNFIICFQHRIPSNPSQHIQVSKISESIQIGQKKQNYLCPKETIRSHTHTDTQTVRINE